MSGKSRPVVVEIPPIELPFHLCRFDSTAHVKRPTYEKIKAAALEAGRYSVFEATQSMRNARWFMQLDKDPEVERFELAFPWIGVRRRIGR